MPFSDTLARASRAHFEELFTIPFVDAAIAGDLSRDEYVAFLVQAYHHVKHTVPLLMATGAALPEDRAGLRKAIATYIEEEIGHEEWILDDIEACGGDREAVRASEPDLPCELMLAYAYDTVHRRNPMAFFGMVNALEGTSTRGATQAARALAPRIGLPPSAFRYLISHGDLDQEHVRFFADLMDTITDPVDQAAILHGARVFSRLYGDVFRGLASRGRPGPGAHAARELSPSLGVTL